jgi:membrane-bound lytic murein transglycosylase D
MTLPLILLFLLPCPAPAETGPGSTIAKASEPVPVIEVPRLLKADETAPSAAAAPSDVSSVAKPENQSPPAVSTSDETTTEVTRPLSITISPHDTKANLAMENSFKMFTQSIKPRFSMWLERSGRYVEIMQKILKEKNMPAELVFLPIVESGFNPKAYSKARAAGPWQFISGTAKRYGLVIDWWKDERKDPVKSTVAAARYLGDLYNMFGSWSLALAAYNAGEGRIAKALRKSNSEDFWGLLGTKQIRQETKDYVPRYIAAAMIANTPEDYGFDDLAYHEPFEYDEVVVYVPVDLDVVAECSGTDVDNIRELNPELRRWSTPPNVREYTLRIPAGKADSFIENLSKIPDDKLFSYDTYVIKKSDTIKSIATRANVPVSAILELNSLAGIERLGAGEKIKLPPHGKYFADIDDRMTALKTAKKNQVNNRHIASKQVNNRHIASKQVNNRHIASKQVNNRHIASKQVNNRHIASKQVNNRHTTNKQVKIKQVKNTSRKTGKKNASKA